MGICAVCHLDVKSKSHQTLTSEIREGFSFLFTKVLSLSSANVAQIMARIDDEKKIVCKSCCGQSQTLTKHWSRFRQTLSEAGIRIHNANNQEEEPELDQESTLSPTKKKATEKLRLCQAIEEAAREQDTNAIVKLVSESPLCHDPLLQRAGVEAKELAKIDFIDSDGTIISKLPSWDKWFEKAVKTAPFLMRLLVRASGGDQEENNTVFRETKRKNKIDVTAAVITAMSVLCNARNSKANSFQTLMALILRHSGVSKWVINLFNNLNLSVSYRKLLRILKKTSSQNDIAVTDSFRNNSPGGFCGDNLNLARIIEGTTKKEMQSVFTWFFYEYRTILPAATPSDGQINAVELTKFELSQSKVDELNKYLLLRFTHLALNNCDLPVLQPLKRFKEEIAPYEIRHQFSEEMSKISKIHVLNTLNFDESKKTGMVAILDAVNDFFYTCLTNAGMDAEDFKSLPLMFAGDCGTEEKAHNARMLRMDGTTPIERMQYLVTWAADWHLRVNYATYINKVFKLAADMRGSRDHIELATAANLLHKKLSVEAKSCVDATFLFHKQYLLASIQAFSKAQIVHDKVPQNIHTLADALRYRDNIIGGLMAKFGLTITRDGVIVNDEVMDYNIKLLHCLLVGDALHDLTRHGNGLIVDFFKYLIPLFRSNDQPHYAGSLTRAVLIAEGIFGPRAAHIIRNERTVKPDYPKQSTNSSGNITVDHHNEHINRIVKPTVRALGPNADQAGLDIASGTLTQLFSLRKEFESSLEMTRDSGYHTTPRYREDTNLLAERLTETNSFTLTEGRKTTGTKVGPLYKVDRDNHKFWLDQRRLELEVVVSHFEMPDYVSLTPAEVCARLYGTYQARAKASQ